jgi:TPR repeat protein
MNGIKLYEKALKMAQTENPDLQKVYDLLEQSAAAECHQAMYALGNWYINGILVKTNHKKAVEWFTKAAELGSPEAHYDLAVSCEEGKGIKKDRNAAMLHYAEAMLLGEKQSIYELGRLLYYYSDKLDIKSLGLTFTDFFERTVGAEE